MKISLVHGNAHNPLLPSSSVLCPQWCTCCPRQCIQPPQRLRHHHHRLHHCIVCPPCRHRPRVIFVARGLICSKKMENMVRSFFSYFCIDPDRYTRKTTALWPANEGEKKVSWFFPFFPFLLRSNHARATLKILRPHVYRFYLLEVSLS